MGMCSSKSKYPAVLFDDYIFFCEKGQSWWPISMKISENKCFSGQAEFLPSELQLPNWSDFDIGNVDVGRNSIDGESVKELERLGGNCKYVVTIPKKEGTELDKLHLAFGNVASTRKFLTVLYYMFEQDGSNMRNSS